MAEKDWLVEHGRRLGIIEEALPWDWSNREEALKALVEMSREYVDMRTKLTKAIRNLPSRLTNGHPEAARDELLRILGEL